MSDRPASSKDSRVGFRGELKRAEGSVGKKGEPEVFVLGDQHGALLVRVDVKVSDRLCGQNRKQEASVKLID